MFCYTGGFSFYAMRGGANLVHSVDASARAIEVTNENVELNFPGDKRHEAFATDAFKYLDDSDQKYDLIVLDPPAFAKHKKVLSNALKGYKRLNLKGFQAIKRVESCLLSLARKLLVKRILEKLFYSCCKCRTSCSYFTPTKSTC